MPEITQGDEAEVTRFLKTAFEVEPAYAGDYARIAAFLSTETLWQEEFKQVSSILHEQFETEMVLGHGNRLTSAISAAAKSLGFDPYAQGVIMAGFTDPEVFKSYVKSHAFWKDAVSSNHGEHSHSLQWLAIANAKRRGKLSLTYKVVYLYERSVDYASTQTFLHSGRNEQATIYLWDFLVDCFDFGTAAADYKTNIRTATARSPSYVNKWVYGSGLWIGEYLKTRYSKRGWGDPGEGTSIKEHAIDKAIQRGFTRKHSNSANNFVYERPPVTSTAKTALPAGPRPATLEVRAPAWGRKGANEYVVSWTTAANVQVRLPVDGAIPPTMDKHGDYKVQVSVVRIGNDCKARLVS
jgi:hypothetical protein